MIKQVKYIIAKFSQSAQVAVKNLMITKFKKLFNTPVI